MNALKQLISVNVVEAGKPALCAIFKLAKKYAFSAGHKGLHIDLHIYINTTQYNTTLK